MSDINEVHKKLVEEAKGLANREKELQRKLEQIRELKMKRKERLENIARLEQELQDLLDD